MNTCKLIIFLSFLILSSLAFSSFPVAYQGRIRPAESYAQLWMYSIHHTHDIPENEWPLFHVENGSPANFLWQLNFHGHEKWDDTPLFWLRSKTVRSILRGSTVSYNQLHQALYDKADTNLALLKPLILYSFSKQYLDPQNHSHAKKLELTSLAPGLWVELHQDEIRILSAPSNPPWQFLKKGTSLGQGSPAKVIKETRIQAEELLNLLGILSRYEQLTVPGQNSMEKAWRKAFQEGKQVILSPDELRIRLESQFPLIQRLKNAGQLFKALPGRYASGEWFPLHALATQVYNPAEGSLQPVGNFTAYSNELFAKIQETYLKGNLEELSALLNEGFATLSGAPYQQGASSTLYYPTQTRLKAEKFYYSYPFIQMIIFGYLLATFVLLIPGNKIQKSGLLFFGLALTLHTFIFSLRWYILQRPPVSNMYETVIYVPWLAALLSVPLAKKFKSTFPILASSILAAVLLTVLELTHLNDHLENVQAVLDSHFWLMIHVLMVVGSYGVLILAGILGHFFLANIGKPSLIGPIILQCMYIGVALLIPGTILGGVWAAESWGRFWDWDPKESWAFISSCIYLLFIHAYRFNYIHFKGLARGSIIGLIAISFTWYGVNYILGTGLHSYGFGSGGEGYYYLFLAFEIIFLVWTGKYDFTKSSKSIKSPNFTEKT